MTTKTTDQQPIYTPPVCQTSICLSGDSLAKLLALLESGADLTKPEGRSFLTSLGFSSTKDPDNWTLGSNTQRYKQCGNAVTVNVVQAVMERLCS